MWYPVASRTVPQILEHVTYSGYDTFLYVYDHVTFSCDLSIGSLIRWVPIYRRKTCLFIFFTLYFDLYLLKPGVYDGSPMLWWIIELLGPHKGLSPTKTHIGPFKCIVPYQSIRIAWFIFSTSKIFNLFKNRERVLNFFSRFPQDKKSDD